ncbi:uncharacterized protein LOC143464511 isoform X2 [Clavelina lepadiformis]|uniref:uncharacterized protein LOC143464511 isoform X2 n=1 Tax=Clavelina lepadiformis TaxID=159417 RepID=UPI004042FC84
MDDWDVTPILKEVEEVILERRKQKRKAKQKIFSYVHSSMKTLHFSNKVDIEDRKKVRGIFHEKFSQITSAWQSELQKLQNCAKLLQDEANNLHSDKPTHLKRKSKVSKLNQCFQASVATVEKLHLQQVKDSKSIHNKTVKKLSQKYLENVQEREMARMKVCLRSLL